MKSSAYSSLDRFLEEHILCRYYKKPKASPKLFRRGLGLFLSVPYEGEVVLDPRSLYTYRFVK